MAESIESLQKPELTGESGGHEISPQQDPRTSLAGMFEHQCHLSPDALAVQTKHTGIPYSKLNLIANHIARAIKNDGIEGHHGVAILFSDIEKTIMAILGTVKSGNYYTAIDVSQPRERIRFMLADSRARTLVTDSHYMELVEEISPTDLNLINVDEIDFDQDCEDPGMRIAPETPLSIVYTSGSSGTPKAIVKTHADRLRSVRRKFFEPGARIAIFFSPSFAAGGGTILRTLLNGASLYAYDIRRDGFADLPEWVRKNKITNLRFTPSLFRQFVRLLSPDEPFPDLQVIGLSTETILKNDIELYKKHFSDHTALMISYACSEVGVIARRFFDKDSQLSEEAVPLGMPSPGRRVLIWDEHDRVVAAGEVGEIIVSSKDIQPSYWNRSADDVKSFQLNPDGSKEYIYRTGDLGKLLPDGQLVHLGRKDSMVKVRGFRVETAAIEMALLQEDGIVEAAVEGRMDDKGIVRLNAYIVLGAGGRLDVGELRRSLARHLPHYMIPARFIQLDEMPLTPTNKLDRDALPSPPTDRQALANPYVAPQDDIEAALVSVWERLLESKPIGVEDDFFDLGGDSLLAAQLFVEIEEKFGRKLPLSILFQASNVREQARILHDQEAGDAWSPLVAFNILGSKPPLFCFPGKGGNPIRFRHLAQRMGDDQPLYMLQSHGLSGRQDPHEDLEYIAAEFLQAMLEVQPDGPYFLIGSSFGGKVAYEIAQQLTAARQQVRLLALVDTYGPGYPKRLPNVTRTRQWFHDRWLFVRKHAGNLGATGWKGKGAYIWNYLSEGIRFLFRLPASLLRKASRPAIPPEMLNVERANLKAGKAYHPRAYPGKVVLFRAAQQPWGIYPDSTLGWGKVGIGDLEIHEIPGHHGSILFEPRVERLAEILKEFID